MTQAITPVPVDARRKDWPRIAAQAINRLQNTTALASGTATWGSITGTLSAQSDLNTALSGKQATLVSGTNIKTVNSTTLLGSGNLAVGTVTSVAQTVPTGFSIAGSPITSTGTLAITFSAGYSLPTDASQTNWNTAFGWGDHASAGYLTTAAAAAAYQPLDTQLTSLAGLSYSGNSLKFVRVNAGETGFELASGAAGYTDEEAQDAVGTILVDSATIDFIYADATPSITAIVIDDSITAAKLADTAVTPGSYTNVSATVDQQGRITAMSSGSLSALYEDQKAANTAGGGSVSGAWYSRLLNTEVFDDIGLALHASTVTITIATPGVVSWTAHGLIAGSTVVFTTTGALPTGLTAGTTYYVIAAGLTADAFQVSATAGGSAVNTSGTQSGTHTATASVLSLAAGTYDVEAKSSFYQAQRCRIRIRDITNGTTLALSVNEYTSNGDAVMSTPAILGRFTLAGTAKVEVQYRVGFTTASNGLGAESNFGEVEVYTRLKLTKRS